MMRSLTAALLLLLLLLTAATAVFSGHDGRERREEEEEQMAEERRPHERKGRMFMLEESKVVVKAEGGEVRVVLGPAAIGDGGSRGRSTMHIGFVSMEPNTLFVPQYIDASLIFFIRRGSPKVGWIHKDVMVEREMRMGDINHIPAGSAFYIINPPSGQRLQLICSIVPSGDGGVGVIDRDLPYRPFYVAGASVLSGFDTTTLSAAFNVSSDELRRLLSRHRPGAGPIVSLAGVPSEYPRRAMAAGIVGRGFDSDEEKEDGDKKSAGWSWWWRRLGSVFAGKNGGGVDDDGAVRAPDSYNLYDRQPDFRNPYGWSLALDERDYDPLRKAGVGVFLVNLTAGSMMAPHVNPTAAEFGVVMGGSGTVEMVFPNGTSAMRAEVAEGDVFWVPRYFPFCHVASRGGPMEFLGFVTSARRNRPQFLVGGSSVLSAMMGPELAAGFGLDEEGMRKLVEAQRESVILPAWPAADEARELSPPPPPPVISAAARLSLSA